MVDIKKVLIFCPDISGHRQVYSCVLAQWLLEQGAEVLLISGKNEDDFPLTIISTLSSRNSNFQYIELNAISSLLQAQRSLVDILVGIEKSWEPTLTLFPTGDEIRSPLKGLGNVKNNSKQICRVAIFIRNTWFYRKKTFGDYLVSPIKNGRHFLWRIKESVWFKKKLWKELGINFAYYINPEFKSHATDRFFYIPDIYKAWGFYEDQNSEDVSKLSADYSDFLSINREKDVVLYYGGRAARRGYDVLLSLSLRNTDTVFVDCGRDTSDSDYKEDINVLAATLDKEGRLFKRDIPFMLENEFVGMLFNSVKYILLPYSEHYGSSGILLQAMEHGKPVVTPDIGQMRYWVENYKIGLTYKHNNLIDFENKFYEMQKTYKHFIPNTFSLIHTFDINHINEVLDKTLTSNL